MILAIMQPYLFPYIGYWQLINAVDTFVIYDDVNFIKQGYINRNNILSNNKKQTLTLELIGASSFKYIKDIEVGRNSNKLLKTIKHNYFKAPYFETIYPMLESILMQDEKNLARFIGYSLQAISDYLNIDTKIIYSSDTEKDNSLKAQDKVIDICMNLNAVKYINAIGGKELYDKESFKDKKIELNFLQTEIHEYKQFNNDFIPYLSIIDVMMFNSKDEVNLMLNEYELA